VTTSMYFDMENSIYHKMPISF